jgi:DNA-binding transcriptional LysR family regulator
MESLENNEIDIIVTYTNDFNRYSKYIFEPLLEERLVIAMHKDLPGAEKIAHLALTRDEILSKDYSPEREIEDVSIFSDFEFLEYPQRSDTSERMSKILGAYKPSRCKIQNARHSEMHYNLMCEGVCATITTTTTVAQKIDDENILFFMPKCNESYRNIYLMYNCASRNKQLIKNFIEVAKDTYASK